MPIGADEPPAAAKSTCKYNHSNAVTMDKETVIRAMKTAGGYTTPHLNDKVLFLFRKCTRWWVLPETSHPACT
jgi:hypothetical protein